ncbi:MAG: patatin-like phospholipase family protein [Vitreoscilla sp.]|nr:patatin-like phospholipase family protein [Vitreoscilla sp.]
MKALTHPGSPARLEQLLSQILASVFGELDASALALLREHLTWVEVAGGQALMVQGEPGDSMYISVSGRLRAYVDQDEGSPRMVREMSRGQVVGEMSLFTDEPRSATVIAIRDSVLVRLDKPHFQALIAQSAQVSVALTRQIIKRMKTELQPRPFAAPVTIGLLPVSEGVASPRFARDLAAQLQQFGRVRVVDGAAVDAELGERIDDRAEMSRRTAMLLDEIEAAHDFVLLVADDGPTDWTRRCARHSDELLLLADSAQPPLIHANETQCLMNRQPATEAAEILVLLHAADAPCPQGTAKWLSRRPVTDHLHIRPTLARDMARLARFEARKAVGLVMAGGGARGFAHLGILRALLERGIEIDCVGGTSMGSLMALLVASDRPLPELMALTRKVFRSNPTGDFNVLPLISLIKGLRMRRMMSEAVHSLLGSDADIEDLWKNYFCIATNYSQAREDTLRSGRLRQAVLASIAIPGAFPPVVRDGDLLCDGGTFNNFPVDVMRARRGVGVVIGADLGLSKPRRIEFDEVPGTWTLLRDRLRPRKARRYRMPSLMNYLLNVTVLYSVSRQRAARRMTDIYFNPPLERVGLLEWGRFDQIVTQGYEHALQVLGPKASGQGPAP